MQVHVERLNHFEFEVLQLLLALGVVAVVFIKDLDHLVEGRAEWLIQLRSQQETYRAELDKIKSLGKCLSGLLRQVAIK